MIIWNHWIVMRKIITCSNFLTSYSILSNTPTHRSREQWNHRRERSYNFKLFPLYVRERSYNFKLFPLYVSPSINKISELWRWLRTIRIAISHTNITGSSSLYKWTPVNCVGDQRRLLLQYYCHFMLNYCVSLNRSPPAFHYPFTSWNL